MLNTVVGDGAPSSAGNVTSNAVVMKSRSSNRKIQIKMCIANNNKKVHLLALIGDRRIFSGVSPSSCGKVVTTPCARASSAVSGVILRVTGFASLVPESLFTLTGAASSKPSSALYSLRESLTLVTACGRYHYQFRYTDQLTFTVNNCYM